MLNLDQIKQLEEKVTKAVFLINSLKEENNKLKLEIHEREKRITELENLVLSFKDDQSKIEEGIISALNHLSAFEDSMYSTHQEAEQAPASLPPDQPAQTSENQALADILNTPPTDPNKNQMEIF
ncbi:cell division protein ZapB [Treponema phagedenis]|uniref:cell division protein ZapB n=1 Tax=Treponema phagedenis TaxID=162 RepID=UPI0001F63E8E|nr:cell division protein ZapB [Treponema phagedenis]EFW37889.1 hypothetical protein HMPREF9554_01611 [Treponema phagedenis F0421]TYT78611.1 hypothetical protein FS559_05475 [Treponema phagedenis]